MNAKNNSTMELPRIGIKRYKMVTKLHLMDLKLKNLEGYFERITDARNQGKFESMRIMMGDLSTKQKVQAVEYYLDKIVDAEKEERIILAKNVRDLTYIM